MVGSKHGKARVTCPYISPLSFYIIIKKMKNGKIVYTLTLLNMFIYGTTTTMEGGEEN